MRALLLLVVLSTFLAGCGGSSQQASEPAPPPGTGGGGGGGNGGGGASQPDEETIYVGSAGGDIVAFALNESDGSVRTLAGGRVSGVIRDHLEASPDGRHLFAGVVPNDRPAIQLGSVQHLALSESGEVAGQEQELASESADFEVSPGGQHVFVHEMFFTAEGETITDSRSVISTYTLAFSASGASASKTSEFTIQHCLHSLCSVDFRLLDAVPAAGGHVLWAWDYVETRGDSDNQFIPLRIGGDGRLSPVAIAADGRAMSVNVPDYVLSVKEASARWVVTAGEPDFGGPPRLFVLEFDGATISDVAARQGCRGRDPNGEPAEHEACETVPRAAVIHPQRDLVFLADGGQRIWSVALRPGSGMDLSTAKSVAAPAKAADMVVTPSGDFLFAVGEGQLMGFRIAADGSLQALSGSPWPAVGGAVAAGNPDGR